MEIQDAKGHDTISPLWVLGVDGGGSKTTAWIGEARSRGDQRQIDRVIGKGWSGPGNPRSVGYDKAVEHVREAVALAISEAGLELSDLKSGCVGLAGAGRIAEQSEIRQRLLGLGFPVNLHVCNDVEPLKWAIHSVAHRLGENSEGVTDCVTLVVGTGSIALGSNANDETQRVGGWGYLLGDHGSGFWIGMRVLQEICVARDRGVAITDLQRKALDVLALPSEDDLVSYVYSNPLPRQQIASIAKIVMEQVDGDPFADSLRYQTIQHWADLVQLTCQKCRFDNARFLLVLGGGVVVHARSWVEEFRKVLLQRGCAPVHCHVVEHPVEGCLVRAMNIIP